MTKSLIVGTDSQPISRAEPSPEASILRIIADAAANPAVDPDKMQRLLDMQEQVLKKQAENEAHAAMNAVQTAVGRISRDAKNTHTNSTYATYAQLDRKLRPVYTSHGFAIEFSTEGAPDGYVRVTATLSRASKNGYPYSHKSQIDVPITTKGPKGNDVMTPIHAVGSATQYGMRYLLKLMFNLAIGEDDDGNGASEDSVPLVSEGQVAELYAILEKLPHGTEEKFLRFIKADSLRAITAPSFGQCKKALETSLSRRTGSAKDT